MGEVVIAKETLFGILSTFMVVLFAGVVVTGMLSKRIVTLVLTVVAGVFGVFISALLVTMPGGGDKGNVFMVVIGAFFGFTVGSAASDLGWLKMKPQKRSYAKNK